MTQNRKAFNQYKSAFVQTYDIPFLQCCTSASMLRQKDQDELIAKQIYQDSPLKTIKKITELSIKNQKAHSNKQLKIIGVKNVKDKNNSTKTKQSALKNHEKSINRQPCQAGNSEQNVNKIIWEEEGGRKKISIKKTERKKDKLENKAIENGTEIIRKQYNTLIQAQNIVQSKVNQRLPAQQNNCYKRQINRPVPLYKSCFHSNNVNQIDKREVKLVNSQANYLHVPFIPVNITKKNVLYQQNPAINLNYVNKIVSSNRNIQKHLKNSKTSLQLNKLHIYHPDLNDEKLLEPSKHSQDKTKSMYTRNDTNCDQSEDLFITVKDQSKNNTSKAIANDQKNAELKQDLLNFKTNLGISQSQQIPIQMKISDKRLPQKPIHLSRNASECDSRRQSFRYLEVPKTRGKQLACIKQSVISQTNQDKSQQGQFSSLSSSMRKIQSKLIFKAILNPENEASNNYFSNRSSLSPSGIFQSKRQVNSRFIIGTLSSATVNSYMQAIRDSQVRHKIEQSTVLHDFFNHPQCPQQ